jgi:hypothetical protein
MLFGVKKRCAWTVYLKQGGFMQHPCELHIYLMCFWPGAEAFQLVLANANQFHCDLLRPRTSF